MPLTDFGSFVGVMDEVDLHWADVNAALGGTPATDLKLEGALTRAEFSTMKDFLEAFLIGFEDLENAREIGAGGKRGVGCSNFKIGRESDLFNGSDLGGQF